MVIDGVCAVVLLLLVFFTSVAHLCAISSTGDLFVISLALSLLLLFLFHLYFSAFFFLLRGSVLQHWNFVCVQCFNYQNIRCVWASLYEFWLFHSFHLFREKALPFVPSHYTPCVYTCTLRVLFLCHMPIKAHQKWIFAKWVKIEPVPLLCKLRLIGLNGGTETKRMKKKIWLNSLPWQIYLWRERESVCLF